MDLSERRREEASYLAQLAQLARLALIFCGFWSPNRFTHEACESCACFTCTLGIPDLVFGPKAVTYHQFPHTKSALGLVRLLAFLISGCHRPWKHINIRRRMRLIIQLCFAQATLREIIEQKQSALGLARRLHNKWGLLEKITDSVRLCKS